eukprot:jgi/Mesvir1/10084/Mv25269-RA.1
MAGRVPATNQRSRVCQARFSQQCGWKPRRISTKVKKGTREGPIKKKKSHAGSTKTMHESRMNGFSSQYARTVAKAVQSGYACLGFLSHLLILQILMICWFLSNLLILQILMICWFLSNLLILQILMICWFLSNLLILQILIICWFLSNLLILQILIIC